MTILIEQAKEKSSIVIDVYFYDEQVPRQPVTPNSVTWTLSDKAGNIVNSRENVPATPATMISIALSGDDLALLNTLVGTSRKLTVKAPYTSQNLGNLEHIDEATFTIEPLVNVS